MNASIYTLIFPFSAHNDEDEGLDGLELYKAIKHAKSHEVTEENEAADEENVLSTKRLIDSYYITYSFPSKFPQKTHLLSFQISWIIYWKLTIWIPMGFWSTPNL